MAVKLCAVSQSIKSVLRSSFLKQQPTATMIPVASDFDPSTTCVDSTCTEKLCASGESLILLKITRQIPLTALDGVGTKYAKALHRPNLGCEKASYFIIIFERRMLDWTQQPFGKIGQRSSEDRNK
jgi:hypothetical protein